MRIQNKLITIFFLTSVVLVVTQVLVMQWSIGKGMIDYVNERELKVLSGVASTLSEIYQKEGSWQKISGNHGRFKNIIEKGLVDSEFSRPRGNLSHNSPRGPRPNTGENQPPRNGPPIRGEGGPNGPPLGRGGPPVRDVSYALLDADKSFLAGLYLADLSFSYIDILDEKEIIGFLAVSKREHLTAGYELNFVKEQQRYILLIALGLVLVAMLIAMPLAAHFVKPIQLLTAAMSKLTFGDYQQRIDLKRKDEFAQLTRDFNELAATLEQNEQARKRWLADISHELRTPVAILKGEMEAMLDGVRRLTLERIQSLSEEITQLEQLLDDLHELTRNDLGTMHYRKDYVDLIGLLYEEAEHYHTLLLENGIEVKFVALPDKAIIFADIKRLRQLLGNIITNVIKYASEGDTLKITVKLSQDTKEFYLRIEDNGLGVDKDDLPHLFEYLFRVEDSRNRETGGSGLGLSICKKIVEAHHGQISAFASDLGGLGILIILPKEYPLDD
jgi:two-component system sensor histidine kinase BaeS